jgi:hypothetical protein
MIEMNQESTAFITISFEFRVETMLEVFFKKKEQKKR